MLAGRLALPNGQEDSVATDPYMTMIVSIDRFDNEAAWPTATFVDVDAKNNVEVRLFRFMLSNWRLM